MEMVTYFHVNCTHRISGFAVFEGIIYHSFIGYLMMTDDWFSEFVYEVVISKKLLSPEILAVLDQEPTVLPAWDPMGSLAH